ncbi:MAG: SOS response-associated peptidase [Oligoflexia bacterium]|nr:SOS response-associated peptidase [Oligoflexia bacterium]
MIEPEQWDTWLDPSLDARSVAALLRPVADGVLRCSPVGTALNNVRQETPDLSPDWTLDQLVDPQLTLAMPT